MDRTTTDDGEHTGTHRHSLFVLCCCYAKGLLHKLIHRYTSLRVDLARKTVLAPPFPHFFLFCFLLFSFCFFTIYLYCPSSLFFSFFLSSRPKMMRYSFFSILYKNYNVCPVAFSSVQYSVLSGKSVGLFEISLMSDFYKTTRRSCATYEYEVHGKKKVIVHLYHCS